MKVEGWVEMDGKIERTFKFENFSEALEFVNKVGVLSEEVQHHPDILIHSYNQVTLSMTTHAAGGTTDKDFDLAKRINSLT